MACVSVKNGRRSGGGGAQNRGGRSWGGFFFSVFPVPFLGSFSR